MELAKEDFDKIRKYIHNICGINLQPGKEYLVQQRLEPMVLSQGCRNFKEFSSLLTALVDDVLRDQIIGAITTNETSFFRDKHPFENFTNLLMPKFIEKIKQRKNHTPSRRGPKLSILSAGSSTGQEPYSLAILINEYLKLNPLYNIDFSDFNILATDISSKVLAKAIAGEYTELEMDRGLSHSQRAVYFRKEGNQWVLNENIRKIVEFKKVNFIENFTHLGSFDLILCRNVLIYFDEEIKKKIFDQFYSMLTDDGFLILGSTENTYSITDKFESVHNGNSVLYRKIV